MALTIQDIPLSVKDHFGSERTSNLLREVSRKAQIVSPGLIPGAIYSLISKDVTAHDFIESLSEDFGLSKTRALAVAKEIKERVLEPVRRDLFRWGIDITAINIINAPDLESLRIEEPEEEKGGVKIPLATFGEKSSVTVPVASSVPEKPVVGGGSLKPVVSPKLLVVDGPLIIHTEGEAASATKEEKKPSRGFSLGFGLFKKREEAGPESPVTARLEIPKSATSDKRQATSKSFGREDKRTVNYSEYRTPITPLGEPENVLKREMRIGSLEKGDSSFKFQVSSDEKKPARVPAGLAEKQSAQRADGGPTEPGAVLRPAEPKKKFFWFGKEKQKPIVGDRGGIATSKVEKVKIADKPFDHAQGKPVMSPPTPAVPPKPSAPSQKTESGSPVVSPPVGGSNPQKKFFWFRKGLATNNKASTVINDQKKREAGGSTIPSSPSRDNQPPAPKPPTDGPILEGNKVDLRSATNN